MELSCRRRQYHHGTTAALRGKPTATPSSKRTPTAHAAAELARGPQGSTPSWWQPGVGGLVTGAIRSLAVVTGPNGGHCRRTADIASHAERPSSASASSLPPW